VRRREEGENFENAKVRKCKKKSTKEKTQSKTSTTRWGEGQEKTIF
jgi:hypothetical protein